tara:strand:+ start:198 stop:536 length:339 start_codon:yes stop_codon:yes gene_type:complete
LATFFSVKQKVFAPKKGWGMLVYAPGWSVASQFWIHRPAPPTTKKNIVFPRPKKCKFLTENGMRRCARPLLKKKSEPKMVLFFFGCFWRTFCRADVDSRDQQAILLKKVKKK